MSKDKVYLGDSVYASSDGYHIVLTTENGMGPTNTIFLDPRVIASLQDYIESVKGPAEKQE